MVDKILKQALKLDRKIEAIEKSKRGSYSPNESKVLLTLHRDLINLLNRLSYEEVERYNKDRVNYT